MTAAVVVVFFLVYLGMILGGLPFLQLDRTGVALLGAIALIAMEAVLLGAVIFVVAALSAVFSNDIVCLSVAPVLAGACSKRGLNPVPYLLALACAANAGSAATLIGNPQNMLIGSALGLSFRAYVAEAAVPVLLGLLATWVVIAVRARGRWALAAESPRVGPRDRNEAPLDRWQSSKVLAVAAVLLVRFLFTAVPREVAALTGAGVLLMSRRLHSNKMLGLVDWELLVLFTGPWSARWPGTCSSWAASPTSSSSTRPPVVASRSTGGLMPAWGYRWRSSRWRSSPSTWPGGCSQ